MPQLVVDNRYPYEMAEILQWRITKGCATRRATECEDKARRRTSRDARAAPFLVCGERSLLVASGAFLCGARKESAVIRKKCESKRALFRAGVWRRKRASTKKERKRNLEKGAVQMEKPPVHERRANGGARSSRKPRVIGDRTDMEGVVRRAAGTCRCNTGTRLTAGLL